MNNQSEYTKILSAFSRIMQHKDAGIETMMFLIFQTLIIKSSGPELDHILSLFEDIADKKGEGE